MSNVCIVLQLQSSESRLFCSSQKMCTSSDFGLNQGEITCTLWESVFLFTLQRLSVFFKDCVNLLPFKLSLGENLGLVYKSVWHGTPFLCQLIWWFVNCDITCCRYGYLEKVLMQRIRSGRLLELSFINFSLLPSHCYKLEKTAHMASTPQCKCHMASKDCEHVR